MRVLFFSLACLAGTAALRAAAVPTADLSTDVDEKTCAVRKPSSTFKASDRQIFFAFVAHDIAAGQQLRIEWLSPSGEAVDRAPYENLPSAPALCFITQLPVSGFPASSQPGAWRVRVLVDDREIAVKPFQILGDGNMDRVRVATVSRTNLNGKDLELTLDGAGFEGTSVVHVAEYTRAGGWRYIRSLLPASATANRLSVRLPALGPGEYLAIVKNADDAASRPARFLVTTGTGYRLPFAVGERWVVTQGPYGGFSHWRNSLHAFDLAPKSGQWVAAMRAGIVYTHDVGAVQSHTRRTFGNYITIQHDDGDFSHYAHLASGSFLVQNGDRVEAGQPLARVGNSGYTLGEGGGYHVHVHVTRSLPASAQSVPFRFMELADVAVTALKGREVSASAAGGFSAPTATAAAVATPLVKGERKLFNGSVAVARTWSDLLPVPAGTKALDVSLAWTGTDRDLDLHLVSPGGRHYGWYGETAGYSGQHTNPERFHVDQPEPGLWRLMAAGMRGEGAAVGFVLDSMIVPAERPKRAAVHHRRASRGAN